MTRKSLEVAVLVAVVFGLNLPAGAAPVFQDSFDGAIPCPWTFSNDSVQINDGYLHFAANGTPYDYARAELTFAVPIALSADRPIVIEQRLKLEYGGENHRLPWEDVYFEGSSSIANRFSDDSDSLGVGYLSSWQGWSFGSEDAGRWTESSAYAPPGENWWTVTQIVLTSNGGELFVKPDGDDNFHSVATIVWSHTQVEGIDFTAPWDSVCDIDYVSVTETPEPATLSLLGLGVFAMLRRRVANAVR